MQLPSSKMTSQEKKRKILISNTYKCKDRERANGQENLVLITSRVQPYMDSNLKLYSRIFQETFYQDESTFIVQLDHFDFYTKDSQYPTLDRLSNTIYKELS